MKNRGDHFGRFYGPFRRETAHRIALADDPPALYAAAGKRDSKTLRPMIAPTGRVYFGCATELGQSSYHRVSEHAIAGPGLRSRRYKPDRTSGNLIFHLGHGDNFGLDPWMSQESWSNTVKKLLIGDQANAIFDQSTSQQTALSQPVHAVTLSDLNP